MLWVGCGGLVVVDLHGLVVLVACDFEQKTGMKTGLEEEQTGKEVQDVEQIDRDISCGLWDEHWMIWDGLGGLVVVDLHGLVGLVA